MGKVMIEESELYDMADAIRDGNGETQTYYPSEMPAAIRRIGGGTGVQEVHEAYVVGQDEYASDWLSYTDGGQPLSPERSHIYMIAGATRTNEAYRWDGSSYEAISAIVDQTVEEDSENAVAGGAVYDALALKAPIASPSLTGTPTAPTADAGDSTTRIATTAYVQRELDEHVPDIATSSDAGIVRPDGTTISVDQDGTIHGADASLLATKVELSAVRDALGELAGDVSDLTNDAGYLDADGPFDATKLTGTVPAANLPSYVDDVVEGYLYQGAFYAESAHETAIVGETGKIYVDLTDDSTYRWSGSAYISISNPIDFATQAEAEAGSDNTKAMTPLRTKQAIDANAYTLPTMSASTKGGATVGEGLAMDGDSLTVDTDEIATREYASEVAETTRTSDGSTAGPISTLTAEGWAEQDGTPSPQSPQEIRVARGRNLLGERISSANVDTSGVVASDTTRDLLIARVESGKTYTISGAIENGSVVYAFYASEPALGSTAYNGRFLAYTSNVTFVAPIDGYVAVRSLKTFTSVQLELGSVATPYVPYGHVGVDVYDGSTHVKTIPIPLPSKGFAGSLPDGTHDTLTLDGAGGYVWTNETAMLSFAVADMNGDDNYPGWRNSGVRDIIGSGVNIYLTNSYVTVGNFVSANTMGAGDTLFFMKSDYDNLTQTEWKSTYPNLVCDFLLPLATPTTESGYVDLPEIPVGASLSISELDGLEVKYFTDGAASTLAHQWYERAKSEYAASIEKATEDALASIAPMEGVTSSTNYSVGDYLVYDGHLCKVTTAIATGEAVAGKVTTTTVMAELIALTS